MTQEPGKAESAATASHDPGTHSTNHVYIWDDEHAWIPAQVTERPSDVKAVVTLPQYANEQAIVCDGGRSAKTWKTQVPIHLNQEQTRNRRTKDFVYPNQTFPLQNVDAEGRLQVVEDMVDLPFLHEAAILYNLKARHIESLPYTRTGDIVIAVNPYQWFHDLYTLEKQYHYGQVLVWNPPEHSVTMPPHVYESSCLSYKGLLQQGEDQSILVSGESGAGKTETVKILLRHLASVQQQQQQGKPVLYSQAPTLAHDNDIVNKVLDTNPLLEAFGNAQTLRNDNSSRFGKYLQLQFHRTSPSHCALAGSHCEVYLLEKSRVTLHHPDERTYHIFYQLLAAPNETKADIWEGLEDTDNESFLYVGWTPTDTIEGETDAERFATTVRALELVGVSGEILRTLWRALCIVLQLGNLQFVTNPNPVVVNSHTSDEGSVVADPDELESLAQLMGIDSATLTTALTIRNVQARSEIFAVPLSPAKAKESTDAFAKEIYAKTFLWLVRTINDATCAERNYTMDGKRAGRSRPPTDYGTIGLLDIFGFETFEVNRFEQLCINYANEKLQQKFTQDIFRSVQVEYEMEGIELEEITYDDNTDVLDLVEGRMGLLAFLNEECVRPKGSDATFVYKAHSMNKENPCFFRDLHAPDVEFGIRHYAGNVTYTATQFVVKNMDTLPSDLQECAQLSTNSIVANELNNNAMRNPLNANAPASSVSATPKAKKRPKSVVQRAGHPSAVLKKRSSNIVAETVWTKFKHQLNRLMDALAETQTRYIRCIKPNGLKKPKLMEHRSTVEQLRCAGVVAAVTISRSAFPNRLEHMIILERFKALWPKGAHMQILQNTSIELHQRTSKATEALLSLALQAMEIERPDGSLQRAFVMGRSRAYFRAGALEFLEGERLKHLGTYVTMIQTQIRGSLCRMHYRDFRAATIRLQSGYRRLVAYQRFVRLRTGAVKIQCWYRAIFAARTIVHLRRQFKATLIQTQWRILRDYRRYHEQKTAIVFVQTMVRGALQRQRYRRALEQQKEDAKLENQVRALQRKLEEAEAKRMEAEKEAEEKTKAAIAKHKEEEERRRQAEVAATKATVEQEDSLNQVAEKNLGKDPVAIEENEMENHIQEEQLQLMDESGKMLEQLRKEVFKLRSQNQQLKTDFDLLKDNNQRLMDANASAGASFAALNQHAKQLSKQNTKLSNDCGGLKAQVQKLNVLQVELKDELKMKQASYVAEVQSRLQYQKALTKITDLIQDRCRDYRLVEKVLQVADECEMEYLNMEEQRLQSPTDHGQANSPPNPPHNEGFGGEDLQGSRSSIFGYFFG